MSTAGRALLSGPSRRARHARVAGGETHGVYVVRDGKAHLTPARLGTMAGGDVEILSGLLPTDRIVVDAAALQGDAVPVEVREGPGRK